MGDNAREQLFLHCGLKSFSRAKGVCKNNAAKRGRPCDLDFLYDAREKNLAKSKHFLGAVQNIKVTWIGMVDKLSRNRLSNEKVGNLLVSTRNNKK